MPISATPMSAGAPLRTGALGRARSSRAGLQLSLPIVAALLITNVALGILTRAAPQLNLFGIGFPITLGVGLLVISLALPYLATPIQNLFNQGIEAARSLPRAGAARAAAPASRRSAAPDAQRHVRSVRQSARRRRLRPAGLADVVEQRQARHRLERFLRRLQRGLLLGEHARWP